MPGRVQVAGPDRRTDGELWLEGHIAPWGLYASQLGPDTLYPVLIFAAWHGRLRVVAVEGDTRFQFRCSEHSGIQQSLNT
jgi:hypothetical protein